MAQRLPTVDSDDNAWGALLNGYLQVGHTSSGTHHSFDVQEYGAKGDGLTDDTTAIQAAITTAQAVFGTVLLPATANGYKVTSQLSITVPIVLSGYGATLNYYGLDDTHLLDVNGVAGGAILGLGLDGSNAGRCRGLLFNNAQDFLVTDLTVSNFTGPSNNFGGAIEATNGSARLHFLRAYVMDNWRGTQYAKGISLFQTPGVHVIDCRLENNGREGLHANTNCDYLLVQGCRFYDNGHSGPGNGAVSCAASLSAGIRIIGSELLGFSSTLVGEDNLEFDRCTDGVIANNVVTKGTWNGLLLDGCDRMTIADNQFYGNGWRGIQLNGASSSDSSHHGYHIVSGNRCYNNTLEGILLTDEGTTHGTDRCVVTGNFFQSNATYGVKVDANCVNNVATANYVYGNTTGTISDAGTGTITTGNWTA